MERINTVVAIVKKEGITSAELVELIKLKLKRLGVKGKIKVGHGGTLDKEAEGVMVIGIGDGTKQLKNFLKGSKEYIATGILGVGTTTYDRDGDVICEKPFTHVDEDKLKNVLNKYKGVIDQIPPVYSALKINGKRASDIIRDGKKVELEPRKIKIYNIDLMGFDSPRFTFKVECSGGTYVRSLIYDIGQDLSTCAYMSKLVRVKQGDFTLENAIMIDKLTLDDLTKNSCSQSSNNN